MKDDEIERALNILKRYPEVAVCRLKGCSNSLLIESEKYFPFRIATNKIRYRLDTQVALWRKEDLISFLNLKENPWQFESNGSLRLFDSNKIFLWHFINDEKSLDGMIYPYHIEQYLGYGIAWGKWLWNNKKWFEQNGIFDVNYYTLGFISRRQYNSRMRFLYNEKKGFIHTIIKKIYKAQIRFRNLIIKVINKIFHNK